MSVCVDLPEEAYHYTLRQWVEEIMIEGLRPGSYATTTAALTPLQAHLDLALAPNTGRRETVIAIDLKKLAEEGYTLPSASRVARAFNMPGGGVEMMFPYRVFPKFLKVAR